MNIPNTLTVARCILAGIFVVLMSFDHSLCYFIAYLVFVAAALTDYFDGKIAREQNLITNFGKLLDPVADKILMVAGFIMLMRVPDLMIPAWTVVAIFAREYLITGARTLAASEGAIIPANVWGKAKTVIQMVYVFVILALLILYRFVFYLPALRDAIPYSQEYCRQILQYLSCFGIIIVSIYTVVSGIQFTWANWNALKLHDI